MAKNKNLQKLELTWIGKGEEPKLERIRPMKYRSVLAEPPTIFYNSGDRGLSGFYG